MSAIGDIIAETDAASAVQASYTTANGEALAQTQSGTTTCSLPDSQGCIRALTNASGSVIDTYRFDAFGNVVSDQETTSTPYGYDSQRYDPAIGLYQLLARSYDTTSGRFLRRDPATSNTSDPSQLDRYIYAAANPVDLSDSSGLDIGEYGQIVEGDTAMAEVELPELSDTLRIALALLARVVESASGAARPERLATEATARAAEASGHARTINDASAISPRRAQASSLRQPVARSFVDFACGPIALLAPAPLSRLFSTPVLRTQMCIDSFWGEGGAQRMRRLVWTHWPMGRRDRVLQWPYQTRWVPIILVPIRLRFIFYLRDASGSHNWRAHRKGETAWLACLPPTRQQCSPSNVRVTPSN